MLVKTEEKAFGPLSWDETRETLIRGQHRIKLETVHANKSITLYFEWKR